MVKFCPECANPIVESNMPFCPKCGAKLPITSPELHQSPTRQPEITPPVQPYTPQASSIPITYSEYQRSFYYSNIFYVVIILDLIISFFFSIIGIAGFFTSLSLSSKSGLTFSIFLLIIFPINFGIDLYFLKQKKKFPNGIDSKTCWIKSIFGFIGILTVLSGLYFLIISISMKRAYDTRIK